MQTSGGTMAGNLRAMAAHGAAGLWLPGLAPTIVREFLYSGPRAGFYVPVRDALIARGLGDASSAPVKVASALITGSVSSLASNPIDVVKIRLMRDPRAYASTGAALRAIVAHEGARGLAKGLAPSVLRASSLSVGQLACYDIIKAELARSGVREGAALHVSSALLTGVAAAFCAAPFDLIKARCMSASGSVETVRSVLRALAAERALPFGLFRGVHFAYLRQGPHALICWPVMEQLRAAVGLPPV